MGGPNHSILLERKIRCFLSNTTSDEIDKISLGRDILSVADVLEPGYSFVREKILLQLAIYLQEHIGMLLLQIIDDPSDDVLIKNIIKENDDLIKEAKSFFCQALKSSKLEEALDGSKETSVKEIEECL